VRLDNTQATRGIFHVGKDFFMREYLLPPTLERRMVLFLTSVGAYTE